jgi:hypothetical protein
MSEQNCPHNVVRKKREQERSTHGELYVCGQCGMLFEIAEFKEPEPNRHNEPMFDHRPPWGSRARQA